MDRINITCMCAYTYIYTFLLSLINDKKCMHISKIRNAKQLFSLVSWSPKVPLSVLLEYTPLHSVVLRVSSVSKNFTLQICFFFLIIVILYSQINNLLLYFYVKVIVIVLYLLSIIIQLSKILKLKNINTLFVFSTHGHPSYVLSDIILSDLSSQLLEPRGCPSGWLPRPPPQQIVYVCASIIAHLH
ncbi:hypothetical protein PV327_008289 [Microctonus hyperodae]|uniref:Uncharacterized protein n=1 Tax=Microctonus hyperodae TaxID=165561 RepID=A0AA39F2T8_MICHY|nr:hypothetical protein PV327_008289 [Microctonus hyperodae]